MRSPIRILARPLRILLGKARTLRTRMLTERRCRTGAIDPSGFDFDAFRRTVSRYVSGMRCETGGIQYRYSAASDKPTLYASAYACMALSLLGELCSYSDDEKAAWLAHFDSFQDVRDGLFYDPAVDSPLYPDTDWWGARHLALHMISAYTDLGGRPKHPFRFLDAYCDPDRLAAWLDRFDWNGPFAHSNDIDNKIMNVGCLLQYQRDAWGDEKAGAAVAFLQDYLAERIDPETGMWGRFDLTNPDQQSRMVQFAYHLFPLFLYDGIAIRQPEAVLDHVLRTQNPLGGFGVRPNSSACEDIDSIDLLIRLAPIVPDRRAEIDAALRKAFGWVLCNQVDDGGFVFRLYEPMTYGHRDIRAAANEGAMLPTWFRTLSLAYLARHLEAPNGFVITPCPGYEF